MKTFRLSTMFLALAFAARCSSSAEAPRSSKPASAYQIVAASGGPLQALAGDALALEVAQTTSDGGTAPLPASARVSWTLPATVTALPADDDADPSPLPAPGSQPTGVFLDTPTRTDRTDPSGLLYVLDPGTVQNAVLQVSATVSGLPASVDAGQLTASIEVSPAPAGDWTRGAALYGPNGANCALCHGPSGHGTAAPNAAGQYVIMGIAYDFPAPGLNAEPGNLADDPAWNAALLAFSARSDVDNGGVTLRFPMPDWLTRPNPAAGAPLSTQDFADLYAFLRTQTQ
jgi:mono/diheme cytochrome c family protein